MGCAPNVDAPITAMWVLLAEEPLLADGRGEGDDVETKGTGHRVNLQRDMDGQKTPGAALHK
jgi:hypothetical protein